MRPNLAVILLAVVAGQAEAQPSRPPTVALLVTSPEGDSTELVFQRAGEAALAPPVAGFRHAPGVAHGELLPGTRTVVAVADAARAREPSWASALFRLEPGKPAVRLVDRVYHSTRPRLTASGRVFVQRGVAGEEPNPELARAGHLRADALTIDEVDVVTGRTRTVHSYSGYITFLGGALGEELIVYRVRHGHADLVAVHADSGAVRVLVPSLPPFARDFAVDASSRALLFTGLEPATRTWAVERLHLDTLERTRLASGPVMSLAAHPWPGGKVAFNPGVALGLHVAGTELRAPLGRGVDFLRGFTRDGAWAVGLHTTESELPEPFVLSTAGGVALPVAAPAGRRVDVAGILEEAGR